jgi:hypothetical protein
MGDKQGAEGVSPEWHELKTSSRLNFVASLVANFIETTTKEPAFTASGLRPPFDKARDKEKG